jgi:energy-coupling factor transporter ATP-binding protein EcfA2
LASALILEPELLLLDEPTARLDPPSRRELLAEVGRARTDGGAAVVHVTHRSEEVMSADRVVGLRAGGVVFGGSPGDLLRSPEADRLGVLWSGLHRLRRELLSRGVHLADCSGPDWNRIDPLLAGLSAH